MTKPEFQPSVTRECESVFAEAVAALKERLADALRTRIERLKFIFFIASFF